MIEYTYFEIFLFCALVIATGYAFKFHEEVKDAKRFIRVLLKEPEVYAKVKKEHDDYIKEMQSVN
jgi:hypothetical protein